MALIGPEDRRRISAAITDAETRTSGEIVAVIAADSASHLSVPFVIAAAVALFVPWPLIYFTWITVQWIYAAQLALFLLLLLALLPRAVRFRLVPRSILESRAHRRAVEQFLTQDMSMTAGRTGVLVFVSVAERYAEIIADTALHDKVEKTSWQEIVDEMTAAIGAGRAGDGLLKAVEQVGNLLARHFPRRADDARSLPDHLIVLD